MTIDERLSRLEDAVANLGSIMEAEGLWAVSENPTVRVFGSRFHEFMKAVTAERC